QQPEGPAPARAEDHRARRGSGSLRVQLRHLYRGEQRGELRRRRAGDAAAPHSGPRHACPPTAHKVGEGPETSAEATQDAQAGPGYPSPSAIRHPDRPPNCCSPDFHSGYRCNTASETTPRESGSGQCRCTVATAYAVRAGEAAEAYEEECKL